MNTSVNKYDALEELIYREGIRIQAIDIHPELNLLLILLNTGGILKESLSKYPRLREATPETLHHYELIGLGTGIHWPDLDEDLSLKSFLQNAVRAQVIPDKVA